ncbi:MAG TPA: excinuclease ABC subunit UvrC [bacterium]|nr:excinuclease ABC subunit UvrC [bacterium]HPG46347.1 excinuclease ABC subunit UvrC [bacterium]HPM98459.1 excinuclease ABC subunit UvrC [bacterium]
MRSDKIAVEEKLQNLPGKPGVYLFRNADGQIIYIGKAKVLRNRVRSYFQTSRNRDQKTRRLVSQIRDLEIILTDSEVEALILESNLVKQHKPKYNINLKDDKTWPYICITKEPFPRVFPTRRIVRDGSRYFGPYTDVGGMKNLLKTLKKIFPLRSCKLALTRESVAAGKYHLCLAYHIKQCQGPCVGLVSQIDYGKMIDHVSNFIEGRRETILEELRQRMAEAADHQQYEQAAYLRDQLFALQDFQEKQKIIDPGLGDRDLFAIAHQGEQACAVVFQVRRGKMIGRQHFFLTTSTDDVRESILQAFLPQYYLQGADVPEEIGLPFELPEESSALQEWLSERRGSRISMVVPKRGLKAQLLRLSEKNASLLLEELQLHKDAQALSDSALTHLQIELDLPTMPNRIEAFDISTLQGSDAVASMVAFQSGHPDKQSYRRFRIRTKDTPDDFAMMREAVRRRYQRVVAEKAPLPDLILLDGGKGQLSAALAALEELDLQNLAVVALAKRLEQVFLPGQSDPVPLSPESPGVLLLRQIRDEAHRFAVSYHRQLRKKRNLESVLDEITGIGRQRKQALLSTYGTLEKLRSASAADISASTHIPLKTAQTLVEKLQTESR